MSIFRVRNIICALLFLALAWLIWWLVPVQSCVVIADAQDHLVFSTFSLDGKTLATKSVRQKGTQPLEHMDHRWPNSYLGCRIG